MTTDDLCILATRHEATASRRRHARALELYQSPQCVFWAVNPVDLSQFTSLFEIGFALHLAVAFLDRIYAKELPVRVDRITARAHALEQLKQLVGDHRDRKEPLTLALGRRTIIEPIWTQHNDYVMDRIYALRQDANTQMKALKRMLIAMTVLSILVVFYSVTVLFLIGLEIDAVMGMDPWAASTVVMMQLLPLPTAAAVLFLVARRMGHGIDRKTRGIGELQLMLKEPADLQANGYASVDQIYFQDKQRGEIDE